MREVLERLIELLNEQEILFLEEMELEIKKETNRLEILSAINEYKVKQKNRIGVVS